MTDVLTPVENRLIGRALHDYSMLAHGDRVLVAVSGGIDSLVLARVLVFWRKKAPIEFAVQAIHLDMRPGQNGPGEIACRIVQQLDEAGLSCKVLPARHPLPSSDDASNSSTKDVCFTCARNRRNQLFEFAENNQYNVLALGHHCDDIVETFFLNLTCAGNISTMRPRQDLFSGRLSLIRPLAYLRKNEIITIGQRLGLQPAPADCPLAGNTRRQDVREMLELIYERIPGSRSQVFAALGNVRQEYLLQPTGKKNANKS